LIVWLAVLLFTVLAACVNILMLSQLRAEIGKRQGQLAAVEGRLVEPNDGSGSAHTNKSLAKTIAGFEGLSGVVQQLNTLSSQNSVALEVATYRVIGVVAGASTGKVQIASHMKGSYAAAKSVIAGLLASNEGLALEYLAIQRVHATDTALDVDVKFAWFYRKDS
jgi:hypothetical protein